MVIFADITMVAYRDGRCKGLVSVLFPTCQDIMTLDDSMITNRYLLLTRRKATRIMDIGVITQMFYKIPNPECI